MVKYSKGYYTNCSCDICEIVDEDDEVVCVVATEDVEKVIQIFNDYEKLKEENQKLMKALGESSRMAVDTLLPKDEDTLTLNGKWW